MSIVAIGILIAFLIVILMNLGGFISQIMGTILYGIAVPLMWILDFVQVLFRKLAGLETTYIKTASGQLIEQKEDILFSLITNRTVLQVFMAMLLVGIVLLIITTIVQMIRTEYTTEGSKNNKGTIIGTALKAFAYFFIVPIACVFGIIVANYLLKAIDVATSAAGARTIAGSVFVAAANDANGVRQRTKTNQAIGVYKNLLDGASFNLKVQYHADTNSYDSRLDNALFKPNDLGDQFTNSENAAVMIDNAFSQGSLLSVLGGGGPVWLNTDELGITDAEIKDTFWNGNTKNVWFSYDNPVAVMRYYNMADINYLILYVGLALCIVTLFKATFGMIKRMYKATMLFIISPGIIGIWPLDGGKAFQSWRTQFISSVLSAYGVIVALNLYFVIVGAIDNIVLFDPKMNIKAVGAISGVLYVMMPPLITLVNATVRALMIIVGALMVSEMASTISSLIGAGDALKEGSEMTGKVAGAIGKGAMVAMGAGALAGKMAKGVVATGKGIGKGVGAIAKGAKEGGFKGAMGTIGGGIKKAASSAGRSIQSKFNGMSKEDNKRISDLKKKKNGPGLTDLEEEELKALKDKKKSITVARDATFNGMVGNFFKQSGMGKALNTMTAGTIEAFGGDSWSKGSKAAQEAHPELATDFAAEGDAIKARQGERWRGKGASERAKSRDTYSAHKDESARREAIITNNNKQANSLLEQIIEELRKQRVATSSGTTFDDSTLKSLQASYLQNRNEAKAMGVANTDRDVTQINELVASHATMSSADYDDHTNGLKGRMNQEVYEFKDGKQVVKLDANNIQANLDSESIRGAFDTAAQSLQAAGDKLVRTAEQMAAAGKVTAAANTGKTEATIRAMSEKSTAENQQIIKLLQDLVNKK